MWYSSWKQVNGFYSSKTKEHPLSSVLLCALWKNLLLSWLRLFLERITSLCAALLLFIYLLSSIKGDLSWIHLVLPSCLFTAPATNTLQQDRAAREQCSTYCFRNFIPRRVLKYTVGTQYCLEKQKGRGRKTLLTSILFLFCNLKYEKSTIIAINIELK
jgi:hypothetical protein